MLFYLLLSSVATEKIMNQQLFHITLYNSGISNFYNQILNDFYNQLEIKTKELDQYKQIKEKDWQGLNKNELYEKLYDWVFDEDFRQKSSYIKKIYGDFYITLETELNDIIMITENIENYTITDFLALLIKTIQDYFKAKFKQLDFSNYDINVLIKHFLYNKVTLEENKQKIVLRSKNPNHIIRLKDLLVENNHVYNIKYNDFLRASTMFEIFKNIVTDKKYSQQQQKIIIIDINSDSFFLLFLSSKIIKHDTSSIKNYIKTELQKIRANINKNITKGDKKNFEDLKKQYNIIFQVANTRADFLSIFFNFIKDMNSQTANLSFKELTDDLHEFQKEFTSYLKSIFDSDKNIEEKLNITVGE